MKTKKPRDFQGYRLVKPYRALTVWTFCGKTRRLILKTTIRPAVKLSMEQRKQILLLNLASFDLPLPK